MSAKAGGGGTYGRIKAKNQEMAARMKAAGIKRNTCACPMCHRLVALNSLPSHILGCKGRK